MRHEEGQSEASTSSTVSYLLTSSTDQSLVWSAIIPGSKVNDFRFLVACNWIFWLKCCFFKVYQWSIIDRKVRYRLDARKILPSSESISTLDIEADQDGHVTVLSLLDKSDGAQLFIGTSKGVVIVAQAIQVTTIIWFHNRYYTWYLIWFNIWFHNRLYEFLDNANFTLLSAKYIYIFVVIFPNYSLENFVNLCIFQI